jgi:hypothetical protein
MQELQSMLAKRETAIQVDFDHLKNRIRCYAHIINVCSSHIIASMMSTSKSYLSDLKVATDSNYATRDDSDGESDNNNDPDDDIALELADCYDDGNRWAAGIKRDPLRRARRVVRLLRSSDQRREGFRRFIQDGNQRDWFTTKDGHKCVIVQVPELQPLRDVKTRWDSVYMMLERLRQLQPVSCLAVWTDELQ